MDLAGRSERGIVSEEQVPATEVSTEVVKSRRFRLSWAWLFPVLAVLAAGWLFWQNERAKGPLIEIAFTDAPGMEPGKTLLIFRGIQAGRVASVRLDQDLGQVIVSVRLNAFAADLAREGTEFWIDKPRISLHGVQGIEALIQGNAIRALSGRADGGPTYRFLGLTEPPLSEDDATALTVNIEAETIPFIARGAPVFHRGTQVGAVLGKKLTAEGSARAQLLIDAQYATTVRENSRFWLLQAASLSASPGEVQLQMPSIGALLNGGVTFDHFEAPGPPAQPGATFELSKNEVAARADGPRLTITFAEAFAMRPGESGVYYRGLPVGIVERVELSEDRLSVRAHVRLSRSVAPLTDSSTVFQYVRPRISWEGITGLEAIIVGPFIELIPGPGGEHTTEFVGTPDSEAEEIVLRREFNGQRISLKAEAIPWLIAGTPVFHRGVQVGAVLEKSASPDGGAEVRIALRGDCGELVNATTRFWRLPATRVAAAPGGIQATSDGLVALLRGGIAFDSFGPFGPPQPEARQLYDSFEMAAAISPPIRIRMSDGQGLLAGGTALRYRGIPVGIVESIETLPDAVVATARFFGGYDFLRREGTRFTVVRPEVSVSGVSGLETLVSGVFIACEKAEDPGAIVTTFRARESEEEQLEVATGFEIELVAETTPIAAGASIIYNEMRVGEITGKRLSHDGTETVLDAKILDEYRHLVRTNSVFWNSTGTKAKIGPFQIRIEAPSILKPHGQVTFSTPAGQDAPPAPPGTAFPLAPRKPRLP